MTESDVAAYIENRSSILSHGNGEHDRKSKHKKPLEYYLEKKNGQLTKHQLPLNESVDQLLSSLSSALESTGLSVVKPPQSPASSTSINTLDKSKFHRKVNQSTKKHSSSINLSYNVNTNRGRNFRNFIENLNLEEIEERKANRINASAAAMVARQSFKFQSIDGTQLGWSSSSLSKTLRMLTKVFDEHNEKFNVDSFYPLQLIFSNDEFHNKLDLYGGTLMLNPGSTQEQWLETLMAVTTNDLNMLQNSRKKLHNNLVLGQQYLHAKIRKGYSCSSEEYYYFVESLAEEELFRKSQNNTLPQPTSRELSLGMLNIVVETSQACRRPVITNTGDISISSTTSPIDVVSSIHRLASDALQNKKREEENANKARELVAMIKYQYGLTKVFKSRLMSVTSTQYLIALTKLLHARDSLNFDELKDGLTGNSLGISHDGSFCCLGDDGSLMIPWNWQ